MRLLQQKCLHFLQVHPLLFQPPPAIAKQQHNPSNFQTMPLFIFHRIKRCQEFTADLLCAAKGLILNTGLLPTPLQEHNHQQVSTAITQLFAYQNSQRQMSHELKSQFNYDLDLGSFSCWQMYQKILSLVPDVITPIFVCFS